MDASGYRYDDWTLLTDMIDSKVRITITDKNTAAKTAKLNLSINLGAMFESTDGKIIYEELIPDGGTIRPYLEHSFSTQVLYLLGFPFVKYQMSQALGLRCITGKNSKLNILSKTSPMNRTISR